MGKKVNVKLDEEIVRRLMRKKNIGDSYDDVIKKLLDEIEDVGDE
jgi:hypothetical protein